LGGCLTVRQCGRIALGDPAQVGSLGQILTDETIGILIGASLPGMVWCRKVNPRSKPAFQFRVVVKYAADGPRLVSADRL